MSFYDDMASTAKEMLSEFGQDVLIIGREDVSTDPVTGIESGNERLRKTIGIMKTYPDNLIDGTRIKSSSRLLTLTADVKPEISDVIMFDGEEWAIDDIKTSNPAGTVLVYSVMVSR